jgi:hypothetical protein
MEVLNDISIVTKSTIDTNELTFNGVKFGDPLSSIQNDIITGGPFANWYHTKIGITFRVDESKNVIEVLLKSELITNLKINQKWQIESHFGAPQSIENKRGYSYYFYPNKSIVLSWKNETDEFQGIYIGKNTIKETTYTIGDFLDKYFEFKSYEPDKRMWNEESLKGNKPKYIRILRLNSFIRAFGLGDDLSDFLNYSFVKRLKPESISEIKEDIKRYALSEGRLKDDWEHQSIRLNSPRNYQMIIQQFLRFLELMNNTLKFNSSWLEASTLTSQYSINKTQNILKSIDTDALDELKRILCNLLDSEKRKFTVSELMKNYGFPSDDLEAIDMENY